MLLICIGTDMAPAIALAYEMGELDIMERMPRNSKLDHLVTKKLIAFSYMQIGAMEVCGGMITYFTVFNDYGFPFTTVTFLN
jgi:sodium/potassium-transporting ATPase subunit alpha